MTIPHMVRAVSSASVLAALVLIAPAMADTEATVATNRDAAERLLPLETRSIDVMVDPGLLKSASRDINTFQEAREDSEDIAESLGMGFLSELVDDNGDIDLPLGVTVFEAMGTTSVGFGGDF